jgi:hypothetical protein
MYVHMYAHTFRDTIEGLHFAKLLTFNFLSRFFGSTFCSFDDVRGEVCKVSGSAMTSTGSSDTVSRRFLLQASSNTTMITRHHHHIKNT